MSDTTLTLALHGERIALEDFAAAVTNFNALVSALSRADIAGGHVAWVIEELSVSSAIIAARAEADEVGRARVPEIARTYITIGERLARHEELVGVPSSVTRPANALVEILEREDVEAILFETPESEAIVRRLSFENGVAELLQRTTAQKPAWGGVTGRVETLAGRGGLRFTLYDTVHDKAVSCYLADGYEDIMRDAWGRLATVEGLVTRDALTGRPLSVRQVRAVTLVEEGDPYGYKRARGVVARPPNTPEPEDVVRRLRDE